MTRLTIAMLGEPHVHVDDAPVACPSKKALGLFLYLAQVGGRPSRRELARLFWGADEEAARTSLRTALQRLPAALAQLLVVDRESIGLHPDVHSGIELDTLRFAALARADDVPSLTQASQLYGGDLLKNLELDAAPEFDDWLLRERTRYRQLAQSVFDRLIVRHRERAQRDTAHASSAREAAFATARRWVELEPAAESAHRWLMQLFFESGQREAALAQFEVCQRELAIALGRSPDAQTRTLFDAIGVGGTGGVGSLAGSPTPPTPSSSPPAIEPTLHAPELAGTSFVGRIDELASLEQVLSDPSCRLLTLHALGGTGKSRLAFALAGQVAARFALGASWVALGAVESAEHLPSAIGRALGFELATRAAPGAALCDALRSQERLLVLDNFEHLIEGGGAELVLSILREAPRVQLVVTSREVLGLQEEWVYELPGLAYPTAALAQAPGPGEFPAVELFLQRARQAYLGFSAQAEWPHVVRICRLVEGLPLAIELAAAWVRTIPCGDLAHAIETEMATLGTRHRNRPQRHRSLDAVVRTAWSLLTREQQQVLAPLSVFVGGFTQEAAHAVADASLRLLSTLVDKSLVHRRADGRFGLHELVRQFLRAHLVARAPAARQTQRRFAVHFAMQLGRLRAQLDGPDELDAEAVLTHELPNLLAASALWAQDGSDLVESTAEPMLRVLMGRGLIRDVVASAARALAYGSPLTPATQTLVLAYRARARCMLGDLPAGVQDFDAAIALGRQHRAPYALAYAEVYAVAVDHVRDEHATVLKRLQGIESLLAELGDPTITMRARYCAGLSLQAKGQPFDAERALREALALAAAIGSPMFLATVQSSLATALLQQGRLEEGEVLLRETLALFERIGSAHNIARVLNSLATAVLWRSNGVDAHAAARDAARDAMRARDLFERVGFAPGRYAALDTLGQALRRLGRFDEAREHFEQAVAHGPPIVASDAGFNLGSMQLEQGQLSAAGLAARQLLETALSRRSEPMQRQATLLAAAIAVRDPRWLDAAQAWLSALLADRDLEFDLRRQALALLAPGPAHSESNADGSATDIVAQLREFLDRDG